jgi:hypothetical protein
VTWWKFLFEICFQHHNWEFFINYSGDAHTHYVCDLMHFFESKNTFSQVLSLSTEMMNIRTCFALSNFKKNFKRYSINEQFSKKSAWSWSSSTYIKIEKIFFFYANINIPLAHQHQHQSSSYFFKWQFFAQNISLSRYQGKSCWVWNLLCKHGIYCEYYEFMSMRYFGIEEILSRLSSSKTLIFNFQRL